MKQELEIVISSEVSDAVKGISDLGKQTTSLTRDTEKSAAAITKSYNNISAASKNLTQANKQLSGTVVNASGTLTSFSRIVQDAPFGIIGVGNNITAFAEQFQYLQKQTGSAGTALKALGSSILGAGGITLGISLLVTGLTQLTQKYGSLENAIDAILFPLNEQQRIQKTINDTVEQGQIEGAKELVHLDKLYRSTQNLNVPLSERNKIVDELQKQYPSYFGNLSNEAVLAGKAAGEYNKLRDALIGAATVRGIDKELENQGAAATKLIIQQKKLGKEVTAAGLAYNQINSRLQAFQKIATGVDRFTLAEDLANLQAELAGADNRLKRAIATYSENSIAQGEVAKTQKELVDIQQQLIEQFGAAAAGVKEVTTAVKQQIEAYEGLNAVTTRQDIFQAPEVPKFKIPLNIQLTGVQEAQRQLQEQIKPVQNTLTQSVESIVIDTEKLLQQGASTIATGIASSIGALIGGATDLKGALNSIIGVFADFISQLGQSLIAAGTATLAAKALSTNPATAIAAGALAVAAGAAIRAALSKTPSFATGGGVIGGPTLAMIGDNPGREEYVIPSEVLDKMDGGGSSNLVASGILRGQDIEIAVRRALQNVNRVNG